MPPFSLSNLFAVLARSVGIGRSSSAQLQEQAARLRLPFAPLPEIVDSIWWQDGPPLQRLADLPRGALSDETARPALRRAIAEADLGVTGVDLAVAETGSLVLLSGAGRPRSTSLVPLMIARPSGNTVISCGGRLNRNAKPLLFTSPNGLSRPASASRST